MIKQIMVVLLSASVLLVAACATISQFDQQAYTNSTSIKVDALNLMDSATGNYMLHQAQINSITTEIEKAYQYEKNRPRNVISTAMWTKLKDTSGYLFGGFIARWKREQTLKPAFIQDAKPIIDSAFDQISQLESGKIKSAQVAN